jgi:phytoene dehydrogenase-like protein
VQKRVAVVGGGINGLVAANYLQRAGFSVTIIEKRETVGGACKVDTVYFHGTNFEYACGASVLGFMQDFVFEDTGLARRLRTVTPRHPEIVYFENKEGYCVLHGDSARRKQEVRAKWGETGDVHKFDSDLERVVEFLCDGFASAKVPTLESAEERLGKRMTDLWITGTARNLLDHYFTSEEMKIFYAIDVVESGPVSLDSPYSAFSVALMASGTVFDGEWGFVKGRIWRLPEELAKINREVGVRILTSARVLRVDADGPSVTYEDADGSEHILHCDRVVFASDPLTAAKLTDQEHLIQEAGSKAVLGTSGKLVLFFKRPAVWKGQHEANEYSDFDMAFKFIVCTDTLEEFEDASHQALSNQKAYIPTVLDVYCEGAAMRSFGDECGYDVVSVFIKHCSFDHPGSELPDVQNQIEKQILAYVENPSDFIGSVFLTPKDLQTRFDFPAGNIDHIELCDKQTYFARNWSPNPSMNFYQFGESECLFYCAAGSYPCGSIAGTPGYMCAKQLEQRLLQPTTPQRANGD